MQNLVELIDITAQMNSGTPACKGRENHPLLAFKNRLTTEKLGQDASHRPYIYGGGLNDVKDEVWRKCERLT